jgi:hypothetical protein
MTDDKPVFEIVWTVAHIKIWANGRVEGVPDGDRALIINRIPAYASDAIQAALNDIAVLEEIGRIEHL